MRIPTISWKVTGFFCGSFWWGLYSSIPIIHFGGLSPKYGVDAATWVISKEMLLPQISSSHPHFGIMFALLPISLGMPTSPSTGPKHFHGPSNRASRRHRHRPSRPFQRVPSTARRPMCSSPLQEGRITKEPMWKLPEKNERMMENWKTPSHLEKMYLLY